MWQQFRLFLKRMKGTFFARSVGAKRADDALDIVLRDFPDAAIRYDADFKIHSLNRAAEALFGVRREEIEGMRIDPGGAEKPHYRLLVQTLFPSLAPASAERSEPGAWPQVVSLAFDNPTREFVAYTIRLPGSSGIPFFFLKIVRDETRLKDAFAARSEFVGVAAHQLRTPLTALKWSLESADGITTKEGVNEILKEARALTDRCLKIVNDFLDAAKMEEGRFGFEYEEVDLVVFLDSLIAVLTPIATQYGVTILFNHVGVAAVPVFIDPSRLGAAISNLLDNAVRYNVKGGRVTVSLSREATQAKISVADTGIGIPKNEERKLFQKLERGSNAIQAEPNGSGLGLYIAKNIVEGHGGTITVESEENRGTTFTISLPLTRENTKFQTLNSE
ncbi:MAG: PAS domain-containing sensor histidine kinase [Candidatus Brennerbacteria bacterium]|nr:PAS domain-containing sensor histidine kinase [Candidatus Brennerbacteria bacterium]